MEEYQPIDELQELIDDFIRRAVLYDVDYIRVTALTPDCNFYMSERKEDG